MNDTIYITGISTNGNLLVGGVWRVYHQDGFPLEMSYLILRDRGCSVDWLEAMADASTDNNLPALMKHLDFLNQETIEILKINFMKALSYYGSYEKILEMKRKALDIK